MTDTRTLIEGLIENMEMLLEAEAHSGMIAGKPAGEYLAYVIQRLRDLLAALPQAHEADWQEAECPECGLRFDVDKPAVAPPAPDARLQDVIDTIEGAYQSLIRWHRKKRDEADARLRGLIERWREKPDADLRSAYARGRRDSDQKCADELEASLRAHEGTGR